MGKKKKGKSLAWVKEKEVKQRAPRAEQKGSATTDLTET
jgi:hypothetical protein